MKYIKTYFLIMLCLSFVSISTAQLSNISVEKSNNGQIITINEFIKLATKNDTEFEKILIDELPLQYRKDLNLP